MRNDFNPTGVGPTSIRGNQQSIQAVLAGLGNPTKAVLFDDFLGDVLDSQWSGGSGADGSDPSINSAVNGKVRLASGGGSTDMATNASALTHGLNWQADQGELVAKAKAQIDTAANGYMFVGLTDTLATSTVELPFELDASDNLTANADDAVGFLYDSTGTGNWFLAGVAGTTAVGPTDTGQAVSDATEYDLEVYVDDAGVATFYLDGVEVGRLQSAVTTSVALTPVVVGSDDNTAARQIDCDFVLVMQDR